MAEKGTTARRILDVDVREVSLVDRAANLHQFLVIKRLEDQLMPAFEEERGQTMRDAEKSKKKVEEMSDEEKKKAEEMTDEEKKKAKMEEEAKRQAAARDEEKQKAMNPAAIAGMLRGLKGAGLPKSAVDSLISWLETQKQNDNYPYPYPKAKTKSMDGVQVAIMDDGGIFVAGQPVVKAKKFTESRTNTVREIVTQLMQLLNEVDQDAVKALVDGFSKEVTEGPGVASMVRPQGISGMQKSDIDFKAEMEKRDTQIADLQKRLDEALGTRQPSKSVGGEGGTDHKTVKKSMWDGVL